jgi:phosphohistidine swiveling domain-containing protein
VRAGLPVPDGYLVEPSHDARAAAAHCAARLRCGRVAVRSAFAVEDGAASSRAGAFRSVLGVDVTDVEALGEAIEAVRASADGHAVGRADVLVQCQVAADRAGVAFTEPDHEDDLVESVEGLADGLLAGTGVGESWELPKLRSEDLWGGPRSPDPQKCRLQVLLRRVRRVFGPAGLDIEWADDGTRVHLVQVRPITAPLLRDDWFTVANHREILPEHPSATMTSVLAESAAELYGWYRRHDQDLPADRLFLEVFAGRPRINLGLLTDTVRILGLPSRLVTDSIGGGADDGPIPQPMQIGRVLRRLPTLLGLLRSQLGSVGAARAAERDFEETLSSLGPAPDLVEIGAALCRVYVSLVHAMFGLTAAMSGSLAALRRAGTLEVHAARHRTVTTRMWEELDAVRAELDADDRRLCAARTTPASARGATSYRAWMQRWGHRGTFESDVARPRFAEDASPVLRALASPAGARRGRVARSLRSVVTLPIWWAARRPLSAREELRDRAMQAFGRLRVHALARAARLVTDGRLPDAESIWQLGLGEWRELEQGGICDAARLGARQRQRAGEARLRLRDVFRRRNPFVTDDEAAGSGGARQLRGLGLTRGVFEGLVVVLDEPTACIPDGVEAGGIVLVVPAIDAGWVPLLTTVGGVIVEIGGELSHGSILVREVGLPAITNVTGALAVLRTGDRVRLDGSSGQVERLGSRAGAGTEQL